MYPPGQLAVACAYLPGREDVEDATGHHVPAARRKSPEPACVVSSRGVPGHQQVRRTCTAPPGVRRSPSAAWAGREPSVSVRRCSAQGSGSGVECSEVSWSQPVHRSAQVCGITTVLNARAPPTRIRPCIGEAGADIAERSGA